MDEHRAPDADVPRPVRDAVLALACEHGVTYQPSPLDDFARHAARLSDAEGPCCRDRLTRHR